MTASDDTSPDGDISSLFSVRGKVAVVTGGSRGIGAMIASGLVRAGCRVYITARKAAECDAKAAELSAFGECVSVPANLGVPGGVDQLMQVVEAREDRLHILVNNAGAAWGAPLAEYPLEAFDKLWNINVKAMFELTVRSLPLLRAAASAADPGRVVNIGSIDGLTIPATENYAYSTTKAGVHMLTRHLAHTLAGDPITVNALAGYSSSGWPQVVPALLTRMCSRSSRSATSPARYSGPSGRARSAGSATHSPNGASRATVASQASCLRELM